LAVPFSQGRHKGHEAHVKGLILLIAVLLLPTLLPEKIGWLTSFVPLPIFYYLVILGKKDGTILIRNAILLSVAGALLIGSMPVLIFSFAMAPLGITFSHAVFRRKNPVETGFVGFLFLAVAWILFWSGLGMIHQINPYTVLLVELDKGLSNGLMLYEESAALAPETLESIRIAVELLRNYIPKVLPALLVSAILTITWSNLVLGNWLLKRKDKKLTKWPDYIEWSLPEPLVWLVIVAGITVFLLPAPMSIIGLNVLIVCATVYFFQGLAIVTSLLNKWSVPMLIRVLIYALIFIQTYGIIILSFLGLADVWADFRKLNQVDETTNMSD
jgi:uncharacterized protein YybS (DUF2232 family)